MEENKDLNVQTPSVDSTETVDVSNEKNGFAWIKKLDPRTWFKK